MTDAPRNQSQTKAAPPQVKSHAAEKAASRPEARATAEPIALPQTVTATATNKAPGLQMEKAVVTAGRAGEKNITIEKFWVEVDGHLPAGFVVGTREGHGLEVLLEQRAYRKPYAGTGSLKTGLTPIATIGTKGRILVTDTTTGETLEQPWTWRSRGGVAAGLWQFIKRLLWKG
jgi:hypothetical protein